MVVTGRGTRTRRGGIAVALAAAGLLTACTPAGAPVQEAAATAPAPGVGWSVSTPATVPAPPVGPSAGAAVAAGPGMPVPQPPRPTRSDRVVPPYVARGESPELTPRAVSCGGFVTPRQVTPGVTPGPGSASVTWQAGGRDDVLGYRVSAVRQTLVPGEQPPPLQQTAAQPAECSPVTVTMRGLVRGEAYVFWLEEETLDAATSAVSFVQIGTSAAVVIGP